MRDDVPIEAGHSIGELFKRLSGDMSLLVRQELDLFRLEMGEKAKAASKAGVMLSGAAVVGLMTLGAFTATLILVLALAMPVWVAALIVTVVYGAVTAGMAVAGKRKVDDVLPPVPKQTVETVKEDVEWAKTQAKSVRR